MKKKVKHPIFESLLLGILHIVGFLLSKTPTFLLQCFCDAIGLLAFHFTSRGQIALSNLYHAYPDYTEERRREIAKESLSRMFEMFLFTLVQLHLSEKRILKILRIPEESRKTINSYHGKKGIVVMVAHTSMSESLVILPKLLPEISEIGVYYRPLDISIVDRFVKKVRSRFGMKLLSRRTDLLKARNIFNNKGAVAFEADQNAKTSGALTTLFGRIVATTDLPGMLAEKHDCAVCCLFPKRTNFWEAELYFDMYEGPNDRRYITEDLNRWLETRLSEDPEQTSNWLWCHNRWKVLSSPKKRLKIAHKKSYLESASEFRKFETFPRKTKLFVRLPDNKEEISIVVPLIKEIRKSRYDMSISLVAKAEFKEYLESENMSEEFIPVPEKSFNYFSYFKKLRLSYPDTWIVFSETKGVAREAKSSRCPIRYGLSTDGKARSDLTNTWIVPNSLKKDIANKALLWRKFLEHFGLPQQIEEESNSIETANEDS